MPTLRASNSMQHCRTESVYLGGEPLRVTILLLVFCCAVALSCSTSFSAAINFCRILLALACNLAMLLREDIYFCLYTFFKRVSARLRSRMLARRFLVASESFLNDAIMSVALCWLWCDLTSCFLTFLFLTCALCQPFLNLLLLPRDRASVVLDCLH